MNGGNMDNIDMVGNDRREPRQGFLLLIFSAKEMCQPAAERDWIYSWTIDVPGV